ncbi:MAG: putative DNA binding domain-containing protein [Elusimicrobia bacterium]|nr:putative DNA binding domain-containing protein [Elusimicrobiota bacterium]
MTESELRTLISAGESFDVEFKGEERRSLSDADLVEAVVCLANRSGDRPGYILVGVEDDGRITGARPRREAGNTIQALISGRTRPSVSVQAALLKIDGNPVLVIQIPPLRHPVGTADGKYIRRALGGDGKPACLPFHFHEMQSLQSSRGVLDFSAAGSSEAAWQDLDPLEFERFRRRIRESQGRGDAALQNLPDIELAKALGAVEANGDVRVIRVLGLLLFGREEALHRLLPAHEAAFQALQGTDVKVNDFFRWPLIRLMDEIEARFRARSQETELMVGMLRVGIPDYPERAVREAVANAV